jgi:hypothetical protein
MSFIEVTSHQDKSAVLIPVGKIAIVMPLPDTERLALGRCVIVLENGIRVTVSESMEELKKLLDPSIH